MREKTWVENYTEANERRLVSRGSLYLEVCDYFSQNVFLISGRGDRHCLIKVKPNLSIFCFSFGLEKSKTNHGVPYL